MSEPVSERETEAEAPIVVPVRLTLKQRLAIQVRDYGKVALITYLTLSILAIAGFSVAIGIGAEPSSATGVFGVIGAGWLAAKATMPIRILVTLALTPVIAAIVARLRPAPRIRLRVDDAADAADAEDPAAELPARDR